jgi:transposase InsO family protein
MMALIGQEVFGMTKEVQREIQRKLRVLQHAERTGQVSKTCRYFGIGRASFYRWKRAYERDGEDGLANAKPIPKSSPNQTPVEVEEKVLHLRRKYHLGPERIMWYMARYHAVRMSDATIYRTLKRHGLNRLPRGTRLRKIHTKRYNKQVPGHHIQMDVKFLTFIGKNDQKVRRFQYTAIDDATRVRALKVYKRHTQANAIDFVNHIIDKFPFRIREIRTDNGHEFQAKFHWHVEDLGIRHAYIKPSSPQLNGKVERSHRSDSQEFYQLLTYKGDVDLEERLDEWERFYNFHRPHGAFKGKTPYEALREKL